MKFFVDARLVNGEPHLRIIDVESGTVRLEWSLLKTKALIRDGIIPAEDFLRPERYGMNLLVRNLFLLSCLDHSGTDISTPNKAADAARGPEARGNYSNPGEVLWKFDLRLGPR